MTSTEAERLGYDQTMQRMAVVRAALQKSSRAYAEGAATALRDFLHREAGQDRASFWFQALGHDAITEPRDAA